MIKILSFLFLISFILNCSHTPKESASHKKTSQKYSQTAFMEISGADKKISKEEWYKLEDSRFDFQDIDGDGVITKKEDIQFYKVLRELGLDPDNNGVIVRSEYRKIAPLPFEEVDRDKSGTISHDELEK